MAAYITPTTHLSIMLSEYIIIDYYSGTNTGIYRQYWKWRKHNAHAQPDLLCDDCRRVNHISKLSTLRPEVFVQLYTNRRINHFSYHT